MKQAVFIVSGFAALWYVWGLSAVSPVPAVALAPCLISLGLMALAWRMPTTKRIEGVGRVVGMASAAEGVGILLAWNALAWVGATAYFPCAVAAIVGLHFLPIAWAVRFSTYYASAAAMVGLGLAGCGIGNPSTRLLAVGVGAASILWLTCWAVLRRGRQFAGAAA